MKKLAILLLAAAFVPAAYASSVEEKAVGIQEALNKAALQAAMQQNRLTKELNIFKEFAYKQPYYNYDFMFQSLDGVRAAYMELRKNLGTEERRALRMEMDEPVKIDSGNNQIQIVDYVNMELVNLDPSEQKLWQEWANAMEEDRKGTATARPAEVKLPDDFSRGMNSFRTFVGGLKQCNADWVLQSMMEAMDAFNANVKKNPQTARAMAKEFVKPVQTGWGDTLNPVSFINNHACELYGPVQNDLYRFAADLQRLSR